MSLMALSRLQSGIDRFIDFVGRTICWLTLLMVLVMTTVVILRYGFNIGWIAMQESVVYMHALVFMLGAAYTLNKDEHVRVDIFYQKFSPKRQALVDLLGSIFCLLPIFSFVLYYSYSYVASSWQLLEGSPEAGGIPAVFLLKSLLLLMPCLMIVQGVAGAIKQILILTNANQKEA